MTYLSLFSSCEYLFIYTEEIHNKSTPVIYVNENLLIKMNYFIRILIYLKILNDNLKHTQN
jgi:hypothetical protein